VTVDAGVVTVTVAAGVDSVWAGDVSVGVDGVLTVGVVAVGAESVGVVRVGAVRVATAALLPPPPQDDRTTEASRPRAPATASLSAAAPRVMRRAPSP
jgi:hypothetical protein